MNFTHPQKINLVGIPGTPYVALADDANLTPKALKGGTIIIEKEIAELPEVRALGPSDVVYDVGAFIGDTAAIFYERGAKVVAFEPQVDAFLALRWNAERLTDFFEPHRIRCFNYALGDGSFLITNQDPIAGNQGTRTTSQADSSGICFSTTLDNFRLTGTDEAPTFIKIDVEGFEPAVIRGGMETLKSFKPKLLIEIYPELLARNGWTAADVVEPLKAIGYTCREVIGNSTEPRWDIFCEIK